MNQPSAACHTFDFIKRILQFSNQEVRGCQRCSQVWYRFALQLSNQSSLSLAHHSGIDFFMPTPSSLLSKFTSLPFLSCALHPCSNAWKLCILAALVKLDASSQSTPRENLHDSKKGLWLTLVDHDSMEEHYTGCYQLCQSLLSFSFATQWYLLTLDSPAFSSETYLPWLKVACVLL